MCGALYSRVLCSVVCYIKRHFTNVAGGFVTLRRRSRTMLLVMLNAIPAAAAANFLAPGAELARHGESPHRPADHPNPQPITLTLSLSLSL